ncbi:hypothetical protein [Streptomyces sp. NPDC005322]|uniref:hypothetical protein n=1 Tax=Streptomyces sp. NPDC005322 TaxID=3157032 RepID=UPI0033B0C13A
MPELDGLEATRLLAGPGVQDPMNVLIATTFDLDAYVYETLRKDACGFLLKDGAPGPLTEAVRAAAADGPPARPYGHVRGPSGAHRERAAQTARAADPARTRRGTWSPAAAPMRNWPPGSTSPCPRSRPPRQRAAQCRRPPPCRNRRLSWGERDLHR